MNQWVSWALGLYGVNSQHVGRRYLAMMAEGTADRLHAALNAVSLVEGISPRGIQNSAQAALTAGYERIKAAGYQNAYARFLGGKKGYATVWQAVTMIRGITSGSVDVASLAHAMDCPIPTHNKTIPK